MSKALAIICIVLGVILLVGFAFGLYVLLESTNYVKNAPKDFWVTIDGKRYYTDSDKLVLSDSDIDVHYLVGWLSGKQGYSYKIVPAGNDFGYMVDGAVGNWLGIEDVTEAFEIVERENGFTIKAKGKKLADVLQTLYPNRELFVPTLEDGEFCFKLVVTSIDGNTVALTFRCVVAVEDIELDPPSVAV